MSLLFTLSRLGLRKVVTSRYFWNMFHVYSSRTNNICESYNHQVNTQIISSKSNVYKVLDLTKKEESLASVSYGRVNNGQEKRQTNKQMVKDAKIALLKKENENGSLEVMDYLLKVSEFCKKYDK